MLLWSAIVLVLAFIGIVINYIWGTPWQLSLHDSTLFLIALGILVRIRYKSKEAEKEKLKQTIDEVVAKKKKKKKKQGP